MSRWSWWRFWHRRPCLSMVAAIVAATGEQLWEFDPRSWETGRPTNLGFNSRGVAHWSDGEAEHIFVATGDAHLWALDAWTGRPVGDFGTDGRVDLTQGLRRAVTRRAYQVMSPPLVVGDVVIVGSSISDGARYMTAPPGDIRAFDVRTGEEVWRFNTVPERDEYGIETWEDDSWTYTGNTNVWSIMSADLELGIVYLPIGTPTNDWYGGHRLGDNLFAESLVAVDAATGERVWHYQLVHHGLWDYDIPAAPTLVDITVDGRPIKAVAQVTKQGFVYVFDRVAVMREGDTRAFYAEVERALRGFLADKLNIAEAGFMSQVAEAELRSRGVPEGATRDYLACLGECDRARFAPPSTSAEEKSGFLGRAAEAMTAVQEGL